MMTSVMVPAFMPKNALLQYSCCCEEPVGAVQSRGLMIFVWRRYDDLKSAGENIELQTTILSRFDLIFIVKDERNADRDRDIAK